jgi:undecaprenyl diphosphate synthase
MALFHRKVATPKLPPKERMPSHVAIIMDGNGRWAKARGLPRIEGHRQGVLAVERILNLCKEIGIRYLTLYCFSNENWKRPRPELDFLMGLLKTYLIKQSESLVAQGVRLQIIGRREGLSSEVLEIMDRTVELSSKSDQFTLCLAINYGSRQEMVDAIRSIATQVKAGDLSPDDINESTIQNALYTRGTPDPDLVIRTSGEMRLSNFLLWQISYSELWVTKKLWPEFSREDFIEAIHDFATRQRRFGGVDSDESSS